VLPDLSVVWVIGFVLLLTALLNRLLFRPVLRVIAERERAIASARGLAEQSATQARAAADEFERKTREARAELYGQMDEMRRAATNTRLQVVADTRAEAEAEVASASARLKVEADDARRNLAAEAEALSLEVAERILGRKAS
jgi:F-type H+-transporting ATPase subunit b